MVRIRGKTLRYGQTTAAAAWQPLAPMDSHIRSFMDMSPAPPCTHTHSERSSQWGALRQPAWRGAPEPLAAIRRPSISPRALLPDTFQALLRLSPDSLKDSLSALDSCQQRSLLESLSKAQAGGPAVSTRLLHAFRPVVATLAAVPFTSMDGLRQRVWPTVLVRMHELDA